MRWVEDVAHLVGWLESQKERDQYKFLDVGEIIILK
jgi:hypothetical protein